MRRASASGGKVTGVPKLLNSGVDDTLDIVVDVDEDGGVVFRLPGQLERLELGVQKLGRHEVADAFAHAAENEVVAAV